MNQPNHALDFILRIDPRFGIRSIAKTVWNAASTDDSIAAKFATIQKLMGDSKPALISEEQYKLYERLKGSIPPLDIPTAPEWIRPAFAAAYLHAKAVVASGRVRGLSGNLGDKLDTVISLVKELEPSFIGDLLIETMLAAHEDKEFGRALTKGANEFRSLASDLYGPNGTDRPRALARMSAGANAGDCTCCRDGACEPCSCWIIVVIIVIIIVAK